jgi:glycosyltransferase involved in cell wall biosynthesis
MAKDPLRVLVVATRAPFPPTGGGSVTLHALLQSLPKQGVTVRVVALGTPGESSREAPYPLRLVEARPRSWLRVVPSIATRTPMAVVRYRLPEVAATVKAELADFAPDVVHLEQLHLAWLIPRIAGRTAVVLRQQNVDSLLLARLSRSLPPLIRWAARLESRRTARFEAEACRSATLVAAISEVDAVMLRKLAEQARVEVLPAAITVERSEPLNLRGSPPFLCLGSFDWLPNRDGARWLIEQIWPRLRVLAPDGVLHLAGSGSATLGRFGDRSIERYGPLADATVLYDPRAVVLIPLRAGSGVRIRLLEAWATGVPAVSSACAAEGLVADDGDGALLARTPEEFAAAAVRLAGDQGLRQRIVARGRAKLAEHTPERVAERARQLYLHAVQLNRS